jgi:hypothetical protein
MAGRFVFGSDGMARTASAGGRRTEASCRRTRTRRYT